SQGALRSRQMVRLALATIAASTATGVHATLTRPLPAFAPHGAHFVVAFVLRDRAGHPVNAAHVTVKVICPTRDAWSYAYACRRPRHDRDQDRKQDDPDHEGIARHNVDASRPQETFPHTGAAERVII